MSGSSQYRFGVLAKIVKHMRTRHQDGDDHPLSLEDILDETNQLDIGSSVKNVIGFFFEFLIPINHLF
jgi:transcription initiation factor TFIIE subunit beta